MQALRLRSRVSSGFAPDSMVEDSQRTESKGIASGIAHSLLLYTVVSPVFSYHLLEFIVLVKDQVSFFVLGQARDAETI